MKQQSNTYTCTQSGICQYLIIVKIVILYRNFMICLIISEYIYLDLLDTLQLRTSQKHSISFQKYRQAPMLSHLRLSTVSCDSVCTYF
jgi:hypothetical protein